MTEEGKPAERVETGEETAALYSALQQLAIHSQENKSFTLYNFLLFNDGYHAEHHAHPGLQWTELPDRLDPNARESRWPAPLGWIDALSLEGLERLVLRWPWLQRFVLASHRQALTGLPRAGHVVIVGGGLFPRTALLLRELQPEARLTIMDADAANLECARGVLKDARIEFVHRRYAPRDAVDCDLLVIPLSFRGDRAQLYRRPPARAVLVHDWIWRPRGISRIVSLALLKRVNLIRP